MTLLAKSVDETTVTGAIGKPGNMLIGNSVENSAFPDSLDDVRIYNYALSEAQIAKLFNGSPLLGKPSNPSPANLSAGAGPEHVNFNWTDSSGAATSYQFLFGSSPDSLKLLATGLTNGHAYGLDSLVPSATYYWRVRSVNATETVLGDTWSFTTGRDTTPPVVSTKNATISLDASGSALISPADINNGSSDLYGIASLSLNKVAFGCSNIGLDTVILTATDTHGNSASATALPRNRAGQYQTGQTGGNTRRHYHLQQWYHRAVG